MQVRVKVKADARREKFEKVGETEFEAAVKEPAERNMANRRVQRLLADHFNLPVTSIRFISGMRSPSKIFEIV
jgi:uncharacterized protein YggU (UPF0235/DUF167 family)